MQNFLPTQPADMLDQSIMEHQPPGSYEDWISLRVGSKGESVHGDFGAHVVAAAPNGLDLINPNGSNEGTIKEFISFYVSYDSNPSQIYIIIII